MVSLSFKNDKRIVLEMVHQSSTKNVYYIALSKKSIQNKIITT